MNTEDGKQVIAFVEAEKEVIEEFYNWAKSNYPASAIVSNVRIEDYRGYVPKIESFALVFNIGQSLKFIESAKEVKSTIKEESEKTRGVIKEESQKTREELGTKIDEVGNKIDLLRMDMKEFIETNMKRIYAEISEIKQALKKAGIM